jgi:hypothetical protein
VAVSVLGDEETGQANYDGDHDFAVTVPEGTTEILISCELEPSVGGEAFVSATLGGVAIGLATGPENGTGDTIDAHLVTTSGFSNVMFWLRVPAAAVATIGTGAQTLNIVTTTLDVAKDIGIQLFYLQSAGSISIAGVWLQAELATTTIAVEGVPHAAGTVHVMASDFGTVGAITPPAGPTVVFTGDVYGSDTHTAWVGYQEHDSEGDADYQFVGSDSPRINASVLSVVAA